MVRQARGVTIAISCLLCTLWFLLIAMPFGWHSKNTPIWDFHLGLYHAWVDPDADGFKEKSESLTNMWKTLQKADAAQKDAIQQVQAVLHKDNEDLEYYRGVFCTKSNTVSKVFESNCQPWDHLVSGSHVMLYTGILAILMLTFANIFQWVYLTKGPTVISKAPAAMLFFLAPTCACSGLLAYTVLTREFGQWLKDITPEDSLSLSFSGAYYLAVLCAIVSWLPMYLTFFTSSSSSEGKLLKGKKAEDYGAVGFFEEMGDKLFVEVDRSFGILEEAEYSDSDEELEEEPGTMFRKRGFAISAEPYGHSIPQSVKAPAPEKAAGGYRSILRNFLSKAALLECHDVDELEVILDMVSIEHYEPGEPKCIVTQGESADKVYIVINGTAECYVDKKLTSESFNPGAVIGIKSLLHTSPWPYSVYSKSGNGAVIVGCLDRQSYRETLVRRQVKRREDRTECLKNTTLLENMNDEQLSMVVDALKVRTVEPGEIIIRQGTPGTDFYIVQSGECVATIETGFFTVDVQEHCRYHAGDLFGELALLQGEPRAATVTAVTQCEILCLSRRRFMRLLGPLDQLHAKQYITDPRKCVADFFQPGDSRGPLGSLQLSKLTPKANEKTDWFIVFRPTSRDAIAKMLAGVAVGKSLNVKGKSAKKGKLSGFVPFIQISDNDHKEKIEESPSNARLAMYYKSREARDKALAMLEAVSKDEVGSKLQIDNPRITKLDEYAAENLPPESKPFAAYGLDVPEALMREAYIMRPDLSPAVGWETGRVSEPAYMDMNLHALRAGIEPKVVVMQHDLHDPMNPRGLLVAYAEALVKPVVSDFDTFTIGSRGKTYESLPEDQVSLAEWSLDQAERILKSPNSKSWTSRWLEILKEEADKGFHPELPKYGFGDPTSYALIGDLVKATLSSGAVRHGAECFNFYFPQELDEEFLVIWEGFPDLPWSYKKEAEVREFLIERANAGFSFPINPVWPVRDKGWNKVMEAVKANKTSNGPQVGWNSQHVLDRQASLMSSFPSGFAPQATDAKPEMSHEKGKDEKKVEFAERLFHKFQKNMQAKGGFVKAMKAG
eukprot:gnl/MRDRNA2_/MRDRNA2_56361_c0_seq1.p1 gnl/MRDRNA2_/MRDRNA2_56361_c0~~gnl/MRDRNA2_/MRDRNA2_56361_c0_seq1.p1  ORF type:complete len:1065 (+),score=203.09 gnl/MRDRNA2_/MRDRNA2_56361_c0_seq1:103-3297(+)